MSNIRFEFLRRQRAKGAVRKKTMVNGVTLGLLLLLPLMPMQV